MGNGIIDLPRTIGTAGPPEEFRRGYVQSFNFTIERELSSGFTAQAAYVGTRGIRQLFSRNINAAGPGGGNAGRALAPRTANINLSIPLTPLAYDSFQAQVRRSTANTTFGLSYTFSKAINYETGDTVQWVPAFDLNRGIASFDRTHNLQLHGIADLPFGKGQRWANGGIASKILGGWQLNATLSAMSGTPFTTASSGASLNAPGNGQTADQILTEVKILGNVGPGSSYFDPNAFAPVTEVRFGTSGRNILRGPGWIQSDLGLFRTFAVSERLTVQLRAEAFNWTNTPAFNNPGSDGSEARAARPGTLCRWRRAIPTVRFAPSMATRQ